MLGISILLVLMGQTTTWAKAYDCGWLLEPSCCDTAYAIDCDTFALDPSAHAYVVVGHTYPGPMGGVDVVVIKVNASDGSVIWSRVYGFPAMVDFNDYGRSVIVDQDMDGVYYVIAGYTMPGVDGSLSDALVFKVNALDGSLIWGWLYSGTFELNIFDDYLYSITDDGGNYIVAGNIEPDLQGGLSDVLVFSVSSLDGSLNWSWAYGKLFADVLGRDDYAYSIIEDHTSGSPCSLFVVAGRSYHEWEIIPFSDVLVFKGWKHNGLIHTGILDYNFPIGLQRCAYSIKNDPHQPGYILTGDVDSAMFAMRLFPNLTVGWAGNCRVYTIPTSAHSRCIEPTSDGNYVFTGWTSPGITGPVDLLVTKINLAGYVVWSKVLTGCQNMGTLMTMPDYGQCIKECKPDTYAVTGYTDWPIPSWSPTNILLAKMDANGNISCPLCPPYDTCMEYIETLVDTPPVWIDTSIVELPLFMPQTEIGSDTISVDDTLICRPGPSGIGEATSYGDNLYGVSNLPNPFTSGTKIYYNLANPAEVRLEIYDLAGREVCGLVEGWVGPGRHAIEWNGRDEGGEELKTGVYLYRIQAGDNTESGTMILIK